MRIFVSIASYRDPLLYDTITSLLENKSGLAEITIGIFEQTSIEDSLIKKHPEILEDVHRQIRYKRIDPEHSDGVGWARHINSLQLTDEDFFYQIDSHMLFDKNWDRNLIKDYQLAAEKHNNNKIVITANCKNFELDKEGNIVKETHTNDITCRSKYFYFQRNYLPNAHGEWIPALDDVSPAIHIFAGNMFTRSDWVRDVGMNPRFYFEGEEQYLTLASYAAGYDLCHPRKIDCYHYRGSNNYVSKQWIDPVISQEIINRNRRISDLEFRSFLLNLDETILESYRKYSGVDYINRKLESRAISKEILPPENLVNDWEIPNRTD